MRRLFSGFVCLVLLTGMLFCTIDSLNAQFPAGQDFPDTVTLVSSFPVILGHNDGHQHDEDYCCGELRSDAPKYYFSQQYQPSPLQLEKFSNEHSLVMQFSVFPAEQMSNRYYYDKIPEKIHRQFTSEYAINNPSTGPPV